MSSTFLPAKLQAYWVGCDFHFSAHCRSGGARQDFFRVWVVIPSALGLCGPHLDWRLAGKPWVSATVASWALSGDLPCLMPASSTMLLTHHHSGEASDPFLNPRSVRDGGQERGKGTYLPWHPYQLEPGPYRLQVGWWLPPRNRVCTCQEPGCTCQERPSPGGH